MTECVQMSFLLKMQKNIETLEKYDQNTDARVFREKIDLHFAISTEFHWFFY